MHTFLTNINSEGRNEIVRLSLCVPVKKKQKKRVAAIVFCMTVSVSHIVAEVFWPTPGLVH